MSNRAEELEYDGYQTWDGEPVSKEPPHGAAIVVFRRAGSEPEFLLLHRGHEGPDYEGDWAWGPPSGARCPGEPIDVCAVRELLEETGLKLPISRVELDSPDWFVYVAEVEPDAEVLLSPEHDRFIWGSIDEFARCVAPQEVCRQCLAAARTVESRDR